MQPTGGYTIRREDPTTRRSPDRRGRFPHEALGSVLPPAGGGRMFAARLGPDPRRGSARSRGRSDRSVREHGTRLVARARAPRRRRGDGLGQPPGVHGPERDRDRVAAPLRAGIDRARQLPRPGDRVPGCVGARRTDLVVDGIGLRRLFPRGNGRGDARRPRRVPASARQRGSLGQVGGGLELGQR